MRNALSLDTPIPKSLERNTYQADNYHLRQAPERNEDNKAQVDPAHVGEGHDAVVL
jgi:hypothetical protein